MGEVRAIALDGSGNVIVAGWTSAGSRNWLVRKYDSTLSTLLASTVYDGPTNGNDEARAVVVAGDGSIVVAGFENAFVNGDDWRIIRYNANLSTVLSTTVHGSSLGNDYARAAALDVAGDIVVAGLETGASGGFNWRVNKYNVALSSILATTSYDAPGGGTDEANALAIDGSGNVIVAGTENGVGGVNWRVIKYDGTLSSSLGTTTFNGSDNGTDDALGVAVDGNGNVVVVGTEAFSGPSYKGHVRKYDSTLGALLASTIYENPVGGHEGASCVVIGGNNTIWVGGTVKIGTGSSDWLVRAWTPTLTATGVAEIVYDGSQASDDTMHALKFDASGNLLLGGIHEGNSNWAVRKYDRPAPPQLTAALSAPADVLAVGRTFDIRLTVTNVGGDPDAINVIPSLQFPAGGSLVALLGGPVPAGPVTLGPCGAVVFTWTLSVAGAGVVAFTGSVTGANGVTAAVLSATATGAGQFVGLAGGPSSATCPAVAGIIGTIAGTGVQGYTGDDIAATSARLNGPFGIVVEPSGNVVVADQGNNMVRRINTTTGVISRVAGTGISGYSGDGGPATAAKLSGPKDVALDAAGNVFILEGGNVRRVDATTGVIHTVAAPPGATTGIAVDPQGRILVTSGGVVRRFDLGTGLISTVAGTIVSCVDSDGISATVACLDDPYGVGTDAAGNVYIAEKNKSRIRRVDAVTGLISTVAGTGQPPGYNGDGLAVNSRLYYPMRIAVDAAGNVLIADQGNHRIRRVDVISGLLTTVAGSGGPLAGPLGDGGAATAATLNNPYGIALGANCRMYIADWGYHRVRAVPGPSPAGGTDANGIPLAVYENLPPVGEIQIRQNVIRMSQGTIAYLVVHGKAAGGTVRVAVVDAAGTVLGRFEDLTLDDRGVGIVQFTGVVGRTRLPTGQYWIVTSGDVAARKPFMVVGSRE